MSGKTARRLRKNHIFSKKTLAMAAGLCLSSIPASSISGEFLVSLYPHVTKPFGEAHEMMYGIGGGMRIIYRPLNFLNVFAQGDYLSMALPGVDPVTIMEGSLGAGYHLDLTERMALDFNLNVGAYNAKAKKEASGISAGGSVIFSYRINPVFYVGAAATATHFAGKPTPLMMINAGLAPELTINISQIFNNKSNIGIELTNLDPVFPVLYSWYENNSFGQVEITNKEDSAITDVVISFYQPQYMAHSKECATIKYLAVNESVTVDLTSFFNEQILELTERKDTNSYIIVNYSRLGKKQTQSFNLDVPVYGRNNMSWDDDRRAAVFVSSKDPAAMQFAKYTASIVRDNLRADVPVNIQYALGIFEALNEFGINYVVDPSSAFEDNVGTSSIDFLQFPYQTLMYRGGDCDDLSILVCSLFEAVGINTAFITVPGHIFMAFDSGLTTEQAKMTFRNMAEFIYVDDEAWVPLEITLSDEGFYKACRYGAREWNTAYSQGNAAMYKMSDSWKIYQPISVPGATAYFNMPESNSIYNAFAKAVDLWSRNEIRRGFADEAVQFAYIKKAKEPEKSETVIKEDPFSPAALKDIIALASNVTAVAPAAVREEELEKEKELENEKRVEQARKEEKTEPEPEPVVEPVETTTAIAESPVVEYSRNERIETTTEVAAAESKTETPAEDLSELIAEADEFLFEETPETAVAETPVAVAETPATEPVIETPAPVVAETPVAETVTETPAPVPVIAETSESEDISELIAEADAFLFETSEETPVVETPAPVIAESPAAETKPETPMVEYSRSERIETTTEVASVETKPETPAAAAEPEIEPETELAFEPELEPEPEDELVDDFYPIGIEESVPDISPDAPAIAVLNKMKEEAEELSNNADAESNFIEDIPENPFAEIEALAAAFLEDNPDIPKSEDTEKTVAAAEPEEPEPTVITANLTSPEQSDIIRRPGFASGSINTGNIVFITSVTFAAALAAGLIIYGKKKREGEKA